MKNTIFNKYTTQFANYKQNVLHTLCKLGDVMISILTLGFFVGSIELEFKMYKLKNKRIK